MHRNEAHKQNSNQKYYNTATQRSTTKHQSSTQGTPKSNANENVRQRNSNRNIKTTTQRNEAQRNSHRTIRKTRGKKNEKKKRAQTSRTAAIAAYLAALACLEYVTLLILETEKHNITCLLSFCRPREDTIERAKANMTSKRCDSTPSLHAGPHLHVDIDRAVEASRSARTAPVLQHKDTTGFPRGRRWGSEGG